MSNEPVTGRSRDSQLAGLMRRVDGIDELLKVSGSVLANFGLAICSACGEATLDGSPGETRIVLHCATAVI